MDNLDAALEYAKRGWKVVPLHYPNEGQCSCGKADCGSPAKHPLTVHGLKDGSTNTLVIRQWWQKWPHANVGVLTGKASGLVVLDIDKKHDGFNSLKKLETNGNLPLTAQVETGGGGRHYFFQSNGRPVRNRASLAGLSGIDVRGDGGYVVAPPSLHISGERYAWRSKQAPTAIPTWLYNIFEAETRRKIGKEGPAASLNEWVALWQGVGEGQRNDACARLAGRLLGRGVPHEEAVAILSVWNQKNSPPLDYQEITQTVGSIARAESTKPQNVGVMSAEYFMTADFDRPPIIIAGGLLFEGTSLMVTGASGAGKSLLTIQMAICISKGIPFLGIEVPNPRQVLFIQAENPDFAVQSRLKRISRGMGVNHLPKIHFVERTFRADINQVRDQRRIIELIEKTQAQVVVLDPLSSYHQCNENDNIAMRRTLDNLTEISGKTKVAWIVVHHEGKPSDQRENSWRFRGASSIRDWADAMVGLIVKPHESRILRLLSFDKIRIGRERASLLLDRDENFCHNLTDEDSIVPMSLIAECLGELGGKAKNKSALAKAISKYVECSSRTIYRAIELSENQVWFQSDNALRLIGKM